LNSDPLLCCEESRQNSNFLWPALPQTNSLQKDNYRFVYVFGRDVRGEAEAHQWRYEVVSAKDEVLLLYLLRTDYIEPNHAITGWNSGNLDALVASTEKAPRIMPQLRGGTVSQMKSSDRKKEDGVGYVLITR